MISNGLRRLQLNRITHFNAYTVLEHKEMEELKKKVFEDR